MTVGIGLDDSDYSDLTDGLSNNTQVGRQRAEVDLDPGARQLGSSGGV